MMTLPAPMEAIQVHEKADHAQRLSVLHKALRKLAWRKSEGDELHADRIKREIQRLEGGGNG